MIAVHSTLLGQAIGGLRIKAYDDPLDGVADCLRLSEAMTVRSAAIDNGTGGAKAVVPLPRHLRMTTSLREAILLDVADQVHKLGGGCRVIPGCGTDPDDMDIMHRNTPYVAGRSKGAGGVGSSSFARFIGVQSAIRCAVKQVLRRETLRGMTVVIVGLDDVGSLLAETFAQERVKLVLSDQDEAKRAMAVNLGAKWLEPERAYLAQCDLLVPCAAEGVLTADRVIPLQCRIICGAAHNQLETDAVALALAREGVTYVPDFIANSGGLIYTTAIELHQRSEGAAAQQVHDVIARNVRLVLESAAHAGVSTQEAALRVARGRLLEIQQRAA